MPSANDSGSRNGLLQKWEEMYAREAALVKAREEEFLASLHGGVTSTDVSQEPSSSQDSASAEAGTNSWISESTPGKSGFSPLASESSLQSPAPTAENPSAADPAAPPVPSSTASSTDGSTQETGASQAGQPDSSADSPQKTEPTPVLTEEEAKAVAESKVDDARKAYNSKDYNLAAQLINDAVAVYPTIDVAMARTAIETALKATTPTQSADN